VDNVKQLFFGVYRGICTNNVDPEGLGRIKAVVPQVFGNGKTETNWAWACSSTYFIDDLKLSATPQPKQGVWIAFEGGDPEYPVWLGVWDVKQQVSVVTAVEAGTGISVNSSDPARPIVSNTGVLTVVAGNNITVTGDPHNPTVNAIVPPAFSVISQTYSVSGPLTEADGASYYLPPFFMPVEPGFTLKLTSVIGMVRSGSLTLDVRQNGLSVGSLSVTTSPSSSTINSVVSENDYFQPVIASVSSADGLSLSFYFTVSR
jgi:hypothetical protein